MNIVKRNITFLILFILFMAAVIGCSTTESLGERAGGSESSKGVVVSPVRDASADSIFSREYIALYNDFRVSQGRSPLKFDPELNRLALTRAAEEFNSLYPPTRIDPNTVWEFVVHLGDHDSPQDLLDAWSHPEYSNWMTRQMMLDWYPRAGFAKVGTVAVHLFVR